jgi:hypothetical protein
MPVAAGDPEREAEYKSFHNWMTRPIRVIKGGSATLQECYLSYEGFVREAIGPAGARAENEGQPSSAVTNQEDNPKLCAPPSLRRKSLLGAQGHGDWFLAALDRGCTPCLTCP